MSGYVTFHLSMDQHFRGAQNIIQLGINDTPLTSALLMGEFKAAEKLIIENLDPSYLDEGPYEKIPLALVLSSEPDIRCYRRHLRLAKLLVERGANPNLRIPQAEWGEANPSPMEYLLQLYDLVLELCRSGSDKTTRNDEGEEENIVEDENHGKVDPLYTIGLHDELNLTPEELREQLLELFDIFLACGGNPNVATTISDSTLFHIALLEPYPDMELVMKLCEAGGDLNMKNCHRTTPLMDLISYAKSDVALDIIHNIWKIKPDISSLQDQNCSDETALWIAMLSGSPQVSIELLEKGASPVPRAFVIIGPRPRKMEIHRVIRLDGVSSIFAALIQDSTPYVQYKCICPTQKFDKNPQLCPFNVHLLDKVFSSTISPVVDALPVTQCFPEPVLQEIMHVIDVERTFVPQSLITPAFTEQNLALLIFGKLSAGLQQMCVRVIMDTVFFSQETKKSLAFIAKLNGKEIISEEEKGKKSRDTNPEVWDDDDNEETNNSEKKESMNVEIKDDGQTNREYIVVEDINKISHLDVTMELDNTVIKKLVKDYLKLPTALVTRFIVEAIRLQIGATLYAYESSGCLHGCDDESGMSSNPSFDIDDSIESSWSDGFLSSSSNEYDYMESELQYDLGEEEEEDDDDDDENL